MKFVKKPLFLMILVLISVAPDTSFGRSLLGRRSYGSASFIKIEKEGFGEQAEWVFSGDFLDQAQVILKTPVSFIQNSSIVELYHTQPILFGVLSVFFFAALMVLCFVVHLARSDSRFC